MKLSNHLMISCLRIFALTLLCLLAGCQSKPQATQSTTDSKEWDALIANSLDSYFAANPDWAVYAGRHEFDGKLPDWSKAGIEREVARWKAEQERVLAFKPEALNERQKFEREYFLAVIEGNLFKLQSPHLTLSNPGYYSFALDPNVYITRKYAPLPQRMRAYIAFAKAVPAVVEQARNNMQLPLPRTFVELGKNTFGGFAEYYEKDVPKVFAAVNDPQLQAELRTATTGAANATKEMANWFEKQRAGATENFALGAEQFSKMLQATERVDVPLETLKKTGQQDLDRNLASLKEACASYAPGKTMRECIDKAQANKPQGGAVEGAQRQLNDLKAFIQEKKLVTIPGTEEARVAEAPPYARSNFAYIDIPGPYEKGLPSIYYIAPPDPSWSEAERNAYVPGVANLRFVTVHEVWPGHFLQYLHQYRSPSKFGHVFNSYAFTEGWGLYAEELMWEAGLGVGNPEEHIGQLLSALQRNVRFLSAIGLHTGQMTVAESEKMFREAAYQDPGNARQQAARGTYDPGYLNYTLGKLMIRKLREDWTATRGGRNAWQTFHDQFLSYGGPPIPLIRKAMLGDNGGPIL